MESGDESPHSMVNVDQGPHPPSPSTDRPVIHRGRSSAFPRSFTRPTPPCAILVLFGHHHLIKFGTSATLKVELRILQRQAKHESTR